MGINDFAERLVNSEVLNLFEEAQPIIKSLTRPWGVNHAPSASYLMAPEEMASIYVFNREIMDVAARIGAGPKRIGYIAEKCHPPSRKHLFCLDMDGDEVGLYVEGDRHRFRLTCFRPLPPHSVICPIFAVTGGFEAPWVKSPVRTYKMIEDAATREVPSTLAIIACLWTFLGLAGCTVTTRTETRFGRMARNGHVTRGTRGICSYNHVDLVVPGGSYVRRSRDGEVRPGVRRHEVRGHWREITRKHEPILRWIDAFYRGNARLGWVLKTRHVKQGGHS